MTYNPEFLPRPDGSRLVLFVAFAEVGLLDLTGPQTVFWAASRYMEKRGLPGYRGHTASLDGGIVPTAEGVAVQTLPLADFAKAAIDTLVVPGSPHIEQVLDRSTALVEWLRHTSEKAHRTASVCTGTFLLAQAGLLENRRAATHWGMCDRLQERFPSIDVDREAIFVRGDPIWSSAGVTAGIDLALALVDELNRWITDNLGDEDLSVELLADKVHMSPRHFARVSRLAGRLAEGEAEAFVMDGLLKADRPPAWLLGAQRAQAEVAVLGRPKGSDAPGCAAVGTPPTGPDARADRVRQQVERFCGDADGESLVGWRARSREGSSPGSAFGRAQSDSQPAL